MHTGKSHLDSPLLSRLIFPKSWLKSDTFAYMSFLKNKKDSIFKMILNFKKINSKILNQS